MTRAKKLRDEAVAIQTQAAAGRGPKKPYSRFKRDKVKRRKKAKTDLKTHYKVPGFNAFASGPGYKKGKVVKCKEPISPETGIHSLVWAAAIVPQAHAGFLKLPYEIRMKIYTYVLEDFEISGTRNYPVAHLAPTKDGKRFKSFTWPTAGKNSILLAETCRQMYVDFVGGGLLYRHIPFSFRSPILLLNYTLVINPAHRDLIRTIRLQQNIGSSAWPTTGLKKACLWLAECRGLQSLQLDFYIEQLFSGHLPRFGYHHPVRLTAFHQANEQRAMAKIETCEQLIMLLTGSSSLRNFKLEFYTSERAWYYYGPDKPFEVSLKKDGDADCIFWNLEKKLRGLLSAAS
ncbi:hypothetical protein B0O99DRAFT_604954 [Bisporella sp. PMI_857]|nr:hypothetical protein B0O99DRAFT_604954 [Bisporella sp. PMI_857]